MPVCKKRNYREGGRTQNKHPIIKISDFKKIISNMAPVIPAGRVPREDAEVDPKNSLPETSRSTIFSLTKLSYVFLGLNKVKVTPCGMRLKKNIALTKSGYIVIPTLSHYISNIVQYWKSKRGERNAILENQAMLVFVTQEDVLMNSKMIIISVHLTHCLLVILFYLSIIILLMSLFGSHY